MQLFVGLRGKEPFTSMQHDVHALLKRRGVPLRGVMELHAKVLYPSPADEEVLALITKQLQHHADLGDLRAVYAEVSDKLMYYTANDDCIFVLPFVGQQIVDEFRKILGFITTSLIEAETREPRFTVAKVPLSYRDAAGELLNRIKVPAPHVRLDELVIYSLTDRGWEAVRTIKLSPLRAVA